MITTGVLSSGEPAAGELRNEWALSDDELARLLIARAKEAGAAPQ